MRGTWVAQSIERLTLDFGSGHDLMVREFEPPVRLRAGSTVCLGLSLSPSLPLSLSLSLSSPAHARALSLKINK